MSTFALIDGAVENIDEALSELRDEEERLIGARDALLGRTKTQRKPAPPGHAEHRVLTLIQVNPGISTVAIVRSVGPAISRPQVYGTVSRLLKKGLVVGNHQGLRAV